MGFRTTTSIDANARKWNIAFYEQELLRSKNKTIYALVRLKNAVLRLIEFYTSLYYLDCVVSGERRATLCFFPFLSFSGCFNHSSLDQYIVITILRTNTFCNACSEYNMYSEWQGIRSLKDTNKKKEQTKR